MKQATPSNYWISPDALAYELNINNDYNCALFSTAPGSVIMAHVPGIIDYNAGHNYRQWQLKASATIFNDNEPRYIYAAIPTSLSANEDALIVFPSVLIDIYGKDAEGKQIGPTKYYYIFLQGIITASLIDDVPTARRWQQEIVFGYLSSDEYIGNVSEWYQYSGQTSIVSFLKDIIMTAGTKFQKLFAHTIEIVSGGAIRFPNGGSVVGIADDGTPSTSADKIATPAYVDATALSKTHDNKTEFDLELKNLRANGNIDVFGNLTVKKDATVSGSFAVGEEATVSGSFAVGEEATVSGNFVAKKDATVFGNFVAEKDAQVSGSFAVGEEATLKGTTQFGTFNKGMQGAQVDFYGNAEFESIVARSFLEVPELRYNRTTITVGNKWQTVGAGIIEQVWSIDGTPATATSGSPEGMEGIAKLKLEEEEVGAIAVDDKCQGVFHFPSGNNHSNIDSHNGNFMFAGFTTVYFVIKEIYTFDSLPQFLKEKLEQSGEYMKDNQFFRYELRAATCSSLPSSDPNRWTDSSHPQPAMSFACYANATNAKRQTSRLTTTTYQLHLVGMTDWTYTQQNIQVILGWLDGFTLRRRVWNKATKQYEEQDKPLHGEGIAVGNIYMWGTIDQFDRAPSIMVQQLYYKATTVPSGSPEGIIVNDTHSAFDLNGWQTDPILPSEETPYIWQQWLYTYTDGTYDVSEVAQSTAMGTPAVAINVENQNVLFARYRDLVNVYVSVMSGNTPVLYGTEDDRFTCSVLPRPLFDDKVAWKFTISPDNTRFYYTLRCLTDKVSELDGLSVDFTVDYKGQTYTRTITFHSVPQGKPGTPGIEGLSIRRSEWQPNTYYRNDSAPVPDDSSSGERYLDEVSITNPATGEAMWYLATAAHNGVLSSDSNRPQTGGNDYWTPINDLRPLRTSYADIYTAFIQFLQVSQLKLQDPQTQAIYGAFGAATADNPFPLWFGGSDPTEAVTAFSKDGSARLANGNLTYNAQGDITLNNITANGGLFTGFMRKNPTYINKLNFDQYCNTTVVGGHDTYNFIFERCGTFLHISAVPRTYLISSHDIAYFSLPSYNWVESGATVVATLDEVRSYVGCTVLIYNDTLTTVFQSASLQLEGAYDPNASVPSRPYLDSGEFAVLDCTLTVDTDGHEQIYWKVTSTGHRGF